MRWLGHAAYLGKRRIAHSVLEGKPKGKRPLGRSSLRWQENSKLDLEEVRWGGLAWTDVTKDREMRRAVVNVVMNFLVPQNEGNFLTENR